MASKIYTVMKDGQELEKVKTLTAAKKLADAAEGEVYCEGKCVYSAEPGVKEQGTTEQVEQGAAEQGTTEQTEAEQAEQWAEPLIVTAEEATDTADHKNTGPDPGTPTEFEDERNTHAGSITVAKYRLKAYMNVREKPSLSAAILGTKSAGETVDVASLENDWLCLTDGSYILYSGGRFAEKLGKKLV